MNYEIDHQKLSEHIFSIIRKTSVPAGLYALLTFIVIGFLYLMAFTSTIGSLEEIAEISKDQAAFEALITQNSIEMILLNAAVGILTHFLLSGVYGMIKKSENSPVIGLSAAFKELFSIKGLKVLNVLIFVQIISGTLSYFLNQEGLSLVAFSLSILIQFLTYFAVPAIYVDNLGVRESIKFSVNTVNQKPAFMFLFMFMTYLVSMSGLLLLGIGIIFTLPLNYIVAYALYKQITSQTTN